MRSNYRTISSKVLTAGTMLIALAAIPFFDQCGAGTENGGEGQKETPDGGAERIADEAREHGRRSTQAKANEVLVPASFLQRRQRHLDQHQWPPISKR